MCISCYTLCDIQWALNSSVQAAIKCTPMELVFRYKLCGKEDDPLVKEVRAVNSKLVTEKTVTFDEVSDRLKQQQKRMRKGTTEVIQTFDHGDLVLVKSPSVATGESQKLEKKYRGPYVVKKILRNDRYVIADIPGQNVSQKRYEGIQHVSRLRPIRNESSAEDD